jgi:hypothetical protein
VQKLFTLGGCAGATSNLFVALPRGGAICLRAESAMATSYTLTRRHLDTLFYARNTS